MGDDTYIVDNAGVRITEAAGPGSGTDTVEASVTTTLSASVDYALGEGQAVEVLRAFKAASGLTLTGNELKSTIFGGAGDDTLVGAGGVDILDGGDGADSFVHAALSDSGTGSAHDTIVDFAPGTDKIDLSLIDADATAGGVATRRSASSASGRSRARRASCVRRA